MVVAFGMQGSTQDTRREERSNLDPDCGDGMVGVSIFKLLQANIVIGTEVRRWTSAFEAEEGKGSEDEKGTQLFIM